MKAIDSVSCTLKLREIQPCSLRQQLWCSARQRKKYSPISQTLRICPSGLPNFASSSRPSMVVNRHAHLRGLVDSIIDDRLRVKRIGEVLVELESCGVRPPPPKTNNRRDSSSLVKHFWATSNRLILNKSICFRTLLTNISHFVCASD